MSAQKKLQTAVNGALRPLGVQIVRGRSADPSVQPFVSARKTLTAARRAHLSVCDYLETVHHESGATQASVDAMIRFGELVAPVERICEIGAGTGRYAEKLIERLQPSHYEVYETAKDWLPHLRSIGGLEIEPADGRSLAATADGSVDLVHANKVFVYLPFPAVVGYLEEMVRVARMGGAIAFDVVTEVCLNDQLVDSWSKEGTIFIPLPRSWLIDFMDRLGATLAGTLRVAMTTATTELMVFRRRA